MVIGGFVAAAEMQALDEIASAAIELVVRSREKARRIGERAARENSEGSHDAH